MVPMLRSSAAVLFQATQGGVKNARAAEAHPQKTRVPRRCSAGMVHRQVDDFVEWRFVV